MVSADLLNLLNEDIALEYSAAVQYVQHSSVVQGVGMDSVKGHLMEHAREELEHARSLSERVAYYGGTPAHLPSLQDIQTSVDGRYALALDLKGEREAIQRYKQRVRMAQEAGEPGLAHLLSEILMEEEEHEDDLLTVLGQSLSGPSLGPQEAAGFLIKLASLEQSRKKANH